METTNDKPQDPIADLEGMTFRLLRHLETIGEHVDGDVSHVQYRVLQIVQKHGPLSLGSLTNISGAAQSTTSELVSRLLKSNLVTKVRGPFDGRVVMVELTVQGEQVIRRHRRHLRDGYTHLLGRLAADDQRAFAGSLLQACELLRKVTE